MGEYQLELWTGGKTYVADPAIGARNDLAERGRGILANKTVSNVRGWRVVRLDKPRPNKPRYNQPKQGRAPDHTADNLICQYLGWAKSVGLSCVSVFTSGPNSGLACYRAELDGFAVRQVNPADWTGPVINEYVYSDSAVDTDCFIGV